MGRLCVVTAMAVMYVMTSAAGSAAPRKERATAGPQGQNLDGKMLTLSKRGGVSFYPFSYFSTSSPRTQAYTTARTRAYTTARTRAYTTARTRAYTTARTQAYTTARTQAYTTTRTRPYTTARTQAYTSAYPGWTTAPPTLGVSVCLRYLTDLTRSFTLFTFSPSRGTPLRLTVIDLGQYRVTFGGYDGLDMRANILLWPSMGRDIWSSVCLTVDTAKSVVQVFSGSNMSIRKMWSKKFAWSGKPDLNIPGFDCQVTDVQVWDYPLRYGDIFNYMSGGVYGPSRGSVLTWSSINYSVSGGDALLEDAYDRWREKDPAGPRGQGRPPKGKKMERPFRFFNELGRKWRKKQLAS